MAKLYKLTESQLQMIYERKLLNEDYPAGADTPDAPWNGGDEQMSTPITADGAFGLVQFEGYEYLLKNNVNGDLFYTVADAFNGDIYAAMHDFLSIPQEQYSDEDGTRLADVTDWEDQITEEDLANALVNYMNYTYAKNMLNVANTIQEWESGQGEFLLITRDSLNQDLTSVIMSDSIRGAIISSFQGH